jgi:hypothetical protein
MTSSQGAENLLTPTIWGWSLVEIPPHGVSNRPAYDMAEVPKALTERWFGRFHRGFIGDCAARAGRGRRLIVVPFILSLAKDRIGPIMKEKAGQI